MKHIVKNCIVCVLLLLLCVSMIPAALAAGTVSYEGSANKFIFSPGTTHSPTNLFAAFQDVMPGDTITEQITIRNDSADKFKVKVYLRSLGAQKDTEAFLSQMHLTVTQKEDSVLFSAPADQTADLKDWVCLGTVDPGGNITLDVTLEVPITMGNEFQNHAGYIDWEFKVEEIPVSTNDSSVPKTGDTGIALYCGMMILSLAALILLYTGKRKLRTC